MLFYIIVTAIVILLALWYYNCTKNYGIFEAKGIVEPPKYFPVGTYSSGWKILFKKTNVFQALDELYFKYSNERYLGIYGFGRPVLVINQLDDVKNILIKDFEHFVDRRNVDNMMGDEKNEANRIIANMLLMLKGEKWKVRSLDNCIHSDFN